MSEKKLDFICLLANTDSSILKVSLDHGFKVESLPEKEGTILISLLEKVSYYEVGKKFFLAIPCLNSSEKKYYFITNSVGEVETDKRGRPKSPQALNLCSRFDNKFVMGYLAPTIQLMRLFKEGNIFMPVYYLFYVHNDIPKVLTSLRRGPSLYTPSYADERYTLEDSEIPSLETFVQNTKLPFARSFLELAFGNFELSYQTPNINLSFLSLMISLEVLFNPGDQELRYRISRNTAVFLGKDRDDSEMIFSEIKELYDKRSTIVHKGERSVVNKEELLKLRHYVRESIKEINRMDKDKNELLGMLNARGFGERMV